MSKDTFHLGDRVTAHDTLRRRTLYEAHDRGAGPRQERRKEWVRNGDHPHGFLGEPHTAPVKPVTGIVVGVRWLDERGTVEYVGYEEGSIWSGDRGARRAALVIAFDMRRRPALAWTDDVTHESADLVQANADSLESSEIESSSVDHDNGSEQ